MDLQHYLHWLHLEPTHLDDIRLQHFQIADDCVVRRLWVENAVVAVLEILYRVLAVPDLDVWWVPTDILAYVWMEMLVYVGWVPKVQKVTTASQKKSNNVCI
jgi:hypothetical protein